MGTEKIFEDAQFTNEHNSMIRCVMDSVEVHIPVDEGNVDYAELIEQGIEIAPYVEPTPSWYDLIAATDKDMPRIAEDIIDTMTPTQFNKLPEKAKDNYDAKKVLRGQQP